jgi:hypothetical protein
MPKGQTRQTYVMIKEPEGWNIAHRQSVRVDADAVKHDPINGPHK